MKKFIWENRDEVINRKFILDNYNCFWKYIFNIFRNEKF